MPVSNHLACACRLITDIKDIDTLAELGVLFLLFEMGLELSIDRLKSLAKYAFGMGSLQMLISTIAFTLFALPLGNGIGTLFLERISDAPDALVTIRSIDEAIVIGASLSLSSSAFVLQLLGERGEMQTRFGSATLGILLLQDIAVVPFLVLLPLIEGGQGVMIPGSSPVSLLTVLGPTVLKTLAGLGVLLLGGRFVLRRIFELVAESKSSESFISLCLLTVIGASQLTSYLGFSDTMGAFIAGVLLSETSYRTQVRSCSTHNARCRPASEPAGHGCRCSWLAAVPAN
jgi:Kef-type K+ transport system membrane component KefB